MVLSFRFVSINVLFFVLFFFMIYSSKLFSVVDSFHFSKSVEERLFIRAENIDKVASNVYFAAPSLLQRWGVINGSAAALYNALTNTIVLDETLFKKDSLGKVFLVTYDDFPPNIVDQMTFSSKVATIFHELSHADFDLFLEEDSSSPIYQILVHDLPFWSKRHVKGVKPKTVSQEFFGYTAGEVVMVLQGEIEKIMMAHGLKISDKGCFNQSFLQRWAHTYNYQDTGPFFVDIWNDDFRAQMLPHYIFVRGKDIDLKGLPEFIKNGVLEYFEKTYSLPLHSQDLIQLMNQSVYYKQKLEHCYRKVLGSVGD